MQISSTCQLYQKSANQQSIWYVNFRTNRSEDIIISQKSCRSRGSELKSWLHLLNTDNGLKLKIFWAILELWSNTLINGSLFNVCEECEGEWTWTYNVKQLRATVFLNCFYPAEWQLVVKQKKSTKKSSVNNDGEEKNKLFKTFMRFMKNAFNLFWWHFWEVGEQFITARNLWI